MKKLLIILIICSISIFNEVAAQSIKEIKQAIAGTCEIDDNGNVTYVKVLEVPNKYKDQIYDILQAYFAYKYNDANEVIQVEDKTTGILIGKGVYSDLIYDMGMWHVIRIDIKDEKVRVITSLVAFYTQTAGIFAKKAPSLKDVCPLNPQVKKQAFYTNLFYKAHKEVISQFDEINRTLKDGNTSNRIEKSDW